VCAVDLSAQDSGDGPVAFIVLIVGAVVVSLALLVEVSYGPPVWLHLLLWLPLTMVLVLALMRPFKAVLRPRLRRARLRAPATAALRRLACWHGGRIGGPKVCRIGAA
jgi:uncharacterized protein (DUF983 family)